MDIIETFSILDHFCKEFEILWNKHLLPLQKQAPKKISNVKERGCKEGLSFVQLGF